MRDLSFEDVFTITKIIKKLNIKNEIRECIKNARNSKVDGNEDIAESLGVDISIVIIENISNAEKEIYSLFASLIGKKVEEVKKMKATDAFETVKELFTSEDMKKVFSTALSLKK